MRIHGEQVFVDGLFNADPHPGNVMLLHGHGDGVGLIALWPSQGAYTGNEEDWIGTVCLKKRWTS